MFNISVFIYLNDVFMNLLKFTRHNSIYKPYLLKAFSYKLYRFYIILKMLQGID